MHKTSRFGVFTDFLMHNELTSRGDVTDYGPGYNPSEGVIFVIFMGLPLNSLNTSFINVIHKTWVTRLDC